MKVVPEQMSNQQLSLELVRSIRDIDVRIDELKGILSDGLSEGLPERRQKIVDRIQKLLETRFSLVYSFMDLNPSFNKNENSSNPFNLFPTPYESLGRDI